MKAKRVWFDKGQIFLETDNGKIGSLQLEAFPRLYNASDKQKMNYNLSPLGIHWPELDEDLSFEGFFNAEPEGINNDVARVLKKFPEINVNQLARRIGINQSLLAKYVCGNKRPSPERLKEIEKALHDLGSELCSVLIQNVAS